MKHKYDGEFLWAFFHDARPSCHVTARIIRVRIREIPWCGCVIFLYRYRKKEFTASWSILSCMVMIRMQSYVYTSTRNITLYPALVTIDNHQLSPITEQGARRSFNSSPTIHLFCRLFYGNLVTLADCHIHPGKLALGTLEIGSVASRTLQYGSFHSAKKKYWLSTVRVGVVLYDAGRSSWTDL